MKKTLIAALSFMTFISLCACERDMESSDNFETTSFPVISVKDDTSSVDTSFKFPAESSFYNKTNQQYAVNDPIASMLAERIEEYLWNDKHIVEDFSDISSIEDISAFRFTAAASYKVPEIINLSSVVKEDPENPVSVLYNRYAEEGNTPVSIYYLDDWQEVIRDLFGNENPALFDFENGQIKSNYGGSELVLTIDTDCNAAVSWGTPVFLRGLPQITFYEENETGYICEAVILKADGILDLSDGSQVKVTEENFSEYSSYHKKYRYVFTKTENGLVLSSLETLR